jgi:hypothetical protein
MTVRGRVSVAFADAVVIVSREVAFIVFVMFGRIADGAEVAWNVRGEGFAADMLQIMSRFVPVCALSGMLFVVTVMSVGAVDQSARDLRNPADVNEEERTNRQAAGNDRRAGRGSPPVRWLVREKRNGFADGNLAEQVAKENEEERRPQERDEAVRVLLQRRTEYFDAKKFQDGFEEGPRPLGRIGLGSFEARGKVQQHENGRDPDHQHLIGDVKATDRKQVVRQNMFHRICGSQDQLHVRFSLRVAGLLRLGGNRCDGRLANGLDADHRNDRERRPVKRQRPVIKWLRPMQRKRNESTERKNRKQVHDRRDESGLRHGHLARAARQNQRHERHLRADQLDEGRVRLVERVRIARAGAAERDAGSAEQGDHDRIDDHST